MYIFFDSFLFLISRLFDIFIHNYEKNLFSSHLYSFLGFDFLWKNSRWYHMKHRGYRHFWVNSLWKVSTDRSYSYTYCEAYRRIIAHRSMYIYTTERSDFSFPDSRKISSYWYSSHDSPWNRQKGCFYQSLSRIKNHERSPRFCSGFSIWLVAEDRVKNHQYFSELYRIWWSTQTFPVIYRSYRNRYPPRTWRKWNPDMDSLIRTSWYHECSR